MNRSLRIVHYCRNFSVGGTEKTAEIFCRHLNREKFEPHAAAMTFVPPQQELWKARLMAGLGNERYQGKLTEWNSTNVRLPNFEEACGAERVHLGGDWTVLRRAILEAKPDIVHIHYGGGRTDPLEDAEFMERIPAVVATHVFAQAAESVGQRQVKKMFFVSDWVRNEAKKWMGEDSRAQVLYNPIEAPVTKENLRRKLGLGEDVFVVGRIGRPASSIHHPLSLSAYAQIEEAGKTVFLAVALSRKMREQAKELKLKTFIELPMTTDETELSRFYNTIDALAHARMDGETFGMNLAEAMRHGKPVVTHKHPQVNGHLEIVGETGLVSGFEDVDGYAAHLKKLRDNVDLRRKQGEACRQRAEKLFDAAALTRQLEKQYEEALA